MEGAPLKLGEAGQPQYTMVQRNLRSSQLAPHLLSLLLILLFWATGLTNLDRFPKIHEDEAWQAAPGYTFWAEGHFGTELFAGFYGMEEHYYGFMPLFPILVGGALHLFGLGLFQARLVPLTLITLSLALTHRLGSKLFCPWHGTLAVAILVGWRVAGPFAHLPSGIPLADVARIVRYDSAVPLFGLAALLLLVQTLNSKTAKVSPTPPHPRTPAPPLPYLTIGGLIGLATLSHLYGAFWLPTVGLAWLWLCGRRALQPILMMGLGFGLTLSPWLMFVASGWADFQGQNQNYADRFGLLDLRFYLINVLQEVERYDPILNGAKQSLGAWLWLIGCGLSLGWLGRVALARHEGMEQAKSLFYRHRRAARILVAGLATLGLLFGLLISFKTFSYLATLWPLFALVIAAGFGHVWRAGRRRRWWRPLLAGLFLLALAEGGLTTWQMQRLAGQNTSYQAYTQTIAAHLPPGSRVLALQHYWLGLAEPSAAYRSLLVPIFWTNPKYVPQPVTFGQAAEAFPPDVILLDQIMLDFLAETADPASEFHPLNQEIWAYLRQRQAQRIGVVEDPTYGRLEIYHLPAETVDGRR